MHFEQFARITENDITQLMDPQAEEFYSSAASGTDVLLYGKNGMTVKARTINQRKMVKSAEKNDLIFAIGPAGTGKTC
jgi:phosphate starvation-inducible PhoH-like protein